MIASLILMHLHFDVQSGEEAVTERFFFYAVQNATSSIAGEVLPFRPHELAELPPDPIFPYALLPTPAAGVLSAVPPPPPVLPVSVPIAVGAGTGTEVVASSSSSTVKVLNLALFLYRPGLSMDRHPCRHSSGMLSLRLTPRLRSHRLPSPARKAPSLRSPHLRLRRSPLVNQRPLRLRPLIPRLQQPLTTPTATRLARDS